MTLKENHSELIFKNPDGYGKSESDCGDLIEFFVKLGPELTVEVEFRMSGCQYTMACARAASLLARGKTLAEARRSTTPEGIARVIQGLPEANFHCAEMASEAMDTALRDAVAMKREPWRKLYRV